MRSNIVRILCHPGCFTRETVEILEDIAAHIGASSNNPAANILHATNSTYVLNYPPVSASGYYDVVVHNIAGYATSA